MKGFDLLAILLNPEFGKMLVHGVVLTLVIALGSWLLAMTLALVLLTLRLTPSKLLQRAVAAYVSYHRNVPTLVQLMLWYFGISSLFPDSVQGWLSEHDGEALFSILALGLCQAAYFSEDLRSGLRSIPEGQAEAARASPTWWPPCCTWSSRCSSWAAARGSASASASPGRGRPWPSSSTSTRS